MEEMKVTGKLTWVSPMRTWTGKDGRQGGSCTIKIDVDEGRYVHDFAGEISMDEAGYMKKQGIKMGDIVELTYTVGASYSDKTEAWYSKVRVKQVNPAGAPVRNVEPVKQEKKAMEEGEDLPF